MKKTIATIAAAVFCTAALSTQAFAADILSDKSVYAEGQEQLARSVGSWSWEDEKVFVDPDTVMPVYTADFYDYARTGRLDIKPLLLSGGQMYISNAENENGIFLGTIEFTVGGTEPGINIYTHTTEKAKSVEFMPNAKRVNALMSKHGINSDCKDIKLLFVENVGYVYYIDNGTSKMLAAANYGEVNGKVFNDENGGIVEINDNLKAIADAELAELEEYQKYLEQLAPGENPVTNGSEPLLFLADNTPYLDDTNNSEQGDLKNPPTLGGDLENPPTLGGDENPVNNPLTGGTGSALAGGIALAACGIGFSLFKKRNT